MATVIVTQAVVSSVLQNIEKAFRAQEEAVRGAINAGADVPELAYRSFVSQEMESELAHIATRTPRGFTCVSTINTIQINLYHLKKTTLPHSWSIPLPQERPWYGGENSNSSYYGMTPVHAEPFEKLMKILLPRFESMREVIEKKDMVIKQSNDLLEVSKTVNKAVKVWPQLINLLPQHTIDKLYAKVERKSAGQEVVIDKEALAAGLAAARLFSSVDKNEFVTSDWDDLDKALEHLMEEEGDERQ